MYFITNRAFDASQPGFDKLTKHPNEKGPNELSVVRINGLRNPTIELLPDELTQEEVQAFKQEFELDLDMDEPHYASLKVACETFREAKKTGKSVLLYVHGYNNDLKDIYHTAHELESLYDVLVVPFTWPANGGGAMSGTLSYLADKRDARASDDALNRVIDIVGRHHCLLTQSTRKRLEKQAAAKFPENPTKQREHLSLLFERFCDVSVNLFCHSMGNYVLKHALKSSLSEARQLVFDNILLVAADTNNEDHEGWVETLRCRKSVYVTINADDYALSWSRRKPGEEQKARLGHYLMSLDAKNALYVDFTNCKAVNRSHSYFDAATVDRNKTVKRFFEKAFSAKNLLPYLDYQAHNNTYHPK
ncbi:alpha/beta hydrolase [Kangiella shandongensis]|uniref:alpha/beta hydrolase n=1 Tax=Kangiella shandongensis TaxID=2763258 RepID=UPI001CBCEE15|nr:alpha/beta hydrolase [Kangiella shandongensis]